MTLVAGAGPAGVTTEACRTPVEEKYWAVVAALRDGIIVVGDDGCIQAANASAETILGVEPDQMVGTNFFELPFRVVDQERNLVSGLDWPVRVTLGTGVAQTDVVLGLVAGGTTRWISLNSAALASSEGDARTVVCSFSDITEAKVTQDQLVFLATHDALTGLANRAGITAYLEAMDHDRPLAVFFVDLDRFKTVNDSMGHRAGDSVLRLVAERLQQGVRRADIVGRLSGDEFVILCPDMSVSAKATSLAQRVLASLDVPMTVKDAHGVERSVTVSASVGIAFATPRAALTDVLVDADVAMYLAKERGRRGVEIFDASLRAAAHSRLDIQADLQAAVEQGGLHLAYQPIVDGVGAVEGYEALVRWTHPSRGVVAPTEFLPLAEKIGLMRRLGAWVLGEATATVATWRREGAKVYLSVNLSGHQLSDSALVATVKEALSASGLEPSALCLEVTETSVMAEPDKAAATLAELKALGVKLALDDFGTGASTLASLNRIPVDILKVDRSFASGLDLGPDAAGNRSIIEAVVSLAHHLGLSVIAEGVETRRQARILRSLHVDALQGYLYGQPEPIPAGGALPTR